MQLVLPCILHKYLPHRCAIFSIWPAEVHFEVWLLDIRGKYLKHLHTMIVNKSRGCKGAYFAKLNFRDLLRLSFNKISFYASPNFCVKSRKTRIIYGTFALWFQTVYRWIYTNNEQILWLTPGTYIKFSLFHFLSVFGKSIHLAYNITLKYRTS